MSGGRHIVIGVTPFDTDTAGDTTARNTLNALLASSYGERYLDPMPGLQAANDGSANDLADIAAGWIPRSLRSDAGHFNQTIGATTMAGLVSAKVLSLGW